jgi:hypothetical protein
MKRETKAVVLDVAAILAIAFTLAACSDSDETAADTAGNGSDSGVESGKSDGSDGAARSGKYRPIVFVHGGAGSADQFEAQALRFASNGFPAEYITGYEYDSTMSLNTEADVTEGIDAVIDKVLAETGAEQVDLLGHSMGTTQSHNYLNSSPERAAKVAHYVNIDGMTSDQPPGGVPTLAILAGLSSYTTNEETGEITHVSDDERDKIGGAENVMFHGITHVQAATCVDSFIAIYKFFSDGKEPATTEVLPEKSNDIELAGRVVYFAYNDSPQNFTLEMYEVNGDTGMRLNDTPIYTTAISGNGEFGKISAKAGVTYEFVTYDETNVDETTQHFYYQPFIRSDYLVRLKTSKLGGRINSLQVRRETQSDLVIVRNKEFVGDSALYPGEEGLANDSLKVDGTELCTKEITPTEHRTIGLFIMDNNSDDQTDLSHWIDGLAAIPFISGADVYIAASDPPNTPIKITVTDRTLPGKKQVLNVPNWVSTKNRITVQFRDFVQ